MQDRPTAAELLADIAELLEGEALDATSGALRHKIRVAGNLCRIIEREVSGGGAEDTTMSMPQTRRNIDQPLLHQGLL